MIDHFTLRHIGTGMSLEVGRAGLNKKYQTPYVGLVIFDDMLLVEIYHLGDDGEEKLDKNICGRVPVLFIRAGTSFYNLFKSHFEQVWKMLKM